MVHAMSVEVDLSIKPQAFQLDQSTTTTHNHIPTKKELLAIYTRKGVAERPSTLSLRGKRASALRIFETCSHKDHYPRQHLPRTVWKGNSPLIMSRAAGPTSTGAGWIGQWQNPS